MTKRMLIDATHPEETRVVVADDDRLIDFDIEIASRRQLKGNIYLAKVTRVEPSLQAAFVDYGGNRHGFLPFSEIHPDYYQIPQADREELERLERELEARANAEQVAEEANGTAVTQDADEETADVLEEIRRRRAQILRSYKIQEVIRRRQIMLVQVVKEERGNKGAALTTYISLPGRYCVLMPNTPKGGGISRKITDPADRRRLKKIAEELGVPEGMGLIIRTAGQERTKAEIRRDYEYLVRLWNEIRQKVLQSIAPCLIYEEGDLVKRALRDLYTRDIEEILVEGEDAYRRAKELMKLMSPSRARHVKLYQDEVPLFARYGIEEQLDAMMSPVVPLPSGGSIVIHATEALTAIDVNSGKATRERHIDDTALKTNLEAAEEIARQLRLRDIAGLVVIDFIDMGESRHQRQVEKRLKQALKADRARIQMGRISAFGLLELSRQRLRPSILELSTRICPTCSGSGLVRSTESLALHALRRIQEEGIKNEAAVLALRVPTEVALYLLNHKREALTRLEERYALRVQVSADDQLGPEPLALEILERREKPAADEETTESAEAGEEARAEGGGRRRRRRRRRRRSGERAAEGVAETAAPSAEEAPSAPATAAEETGDTASEPAAATAAPAADQAAVAGEVEGVAEESAEVGEEARAEGGGRRRRRRRRRRRSGERVAEPFETAASPAEEAPAELRDAGEAGPVEATPEAVVAEVLAMVEADAPGTAATGGEAMADGGRAQATVSSADGDGRGAVDLGELDADPAATPPAREVMAQAEALATTAALESPGAMEARHAAEDGSRPNGGREARSEAAAEGRNGAPQAPAGETGETSVSAGDAAAAAESGEAPDAGGEASGSEGTAQARRRSGWWSRWLS